MFLYTTQRPFDISQYPRNAKHFTIWSQSRKYRRQIFVTLRLWFIELHPSTRYLVTKKEEDMFSFLLFSVSFIFLWLLVIKKELQCFLFFAFFIYIFFFLVYKFRICRVGLFFFFCSLCFNCFMWQCRIFRVNVEFCSIGKH